MGDREPLGFTSVQILVIVIIFGILGLLSIPRWLAFTHTQRLKAATEPVRIAIQDTSSEAIRLKRPFQVMLREKNGRVEVGIMEASEASLARLAGSLEKVTWSPLSEGISIDATSSYLFNLNSTHDFYWMRFADDGSVASMVDLSTNNRITFALTEQLANPKRRKRCEIVLTDLGVVESFQNADCDQSR